MLKLARYLKGYWVPTILAPLFKLIEAIFELIVPLVMANIIDKGITNGDRTYIIKMGLIMLLLGVLGLIFSVTAQYFAAVASYGFGTKLRNDMFELINRFSHNDIDKFGTPSLITRMTSDINQVQSGVNMVLRLFTRAPFLVIGATITAFTIDAKLSAIFILSIPLITLAVYSIMKISIPYYNKIQGTLDKVARILRENLAGVRVIRAFSRQEYEKEKFEDTTDYLKKITIRVGKISSLLNPVTYIIMNLAIIAILWFGGMRVDSGSLTQGEIIALVNYITQILLALIVVANLVIIYTKASASAIRVNEVLDTKESIIFNNEEIEEFSDTSEIIEFKDVCFSYEGSDEYSLEGINLSLKSGQTIGIIGGTGSGKSTLVNLIPRFYDSTKGDILIKGRNVRDFSFAQLRSIIGIVPQKAVLYSGTVRDNLKWRDEEASDAEILDAIDIAQANDFIQRLPYGLDTEIFQGGKNLSGGQKQRLTIARALVKKPEILILDDSASALDYATDARLRKALSERTTDMTVIIVSQRAATIKNSNQIIVLDDGKVVGLGKHNELLQNCQVYNEICHSQNIGLEVVSDE